MDPAVDSLTQGYAELAAGCWHAARECLTRAVERQDSGPALAGLASAAWWLGDTDAGVEAASRAYLRFREAGDVVGVVRMAVWLALVNVSNLGNMAAASGWLARAERELQSLPPGPLHGWTWIGRGHRNPDLEQADELSARALEIARQAGDVDLELVAIAQLGYGRVARGETDAGLALVDEAMAGALAGERSSLDTVVFTCCDMLNACDVADDLERAAHWCQVADGFIERYGCPFLYAECRMLYGGLLVSHGRWEAGERELALALGAAAGGVAAVRARAVARLVSLRLRQGRIEAAEALLGELDPRHDEEVDVVAARAAVLVATGRPETAAQLLRHAAGRARRHRASAVAVLESLVEAELAAGNLDGAEDASARLEGLAGPADRAAALAADARGRTALATGELEAAAAALQDALVRWSRLPAPFERARCQAALAAALAGSAPELAVEHARRAQSALRELGAAAEVDRVAAFLRTQGVGAGPRPRHAGTITAREREVLALLAVGLSNKEIAARLHVSRKTAEHHVSSILAKLGLRNRAEAAVYATRSEPH